jgi:hypothetical protein
MIMSMKNYTDTIGHRSRALPVCSAVPQGIGYDNIKKLIQFNSMFFTTMPFAFCLKN